MLIFELSKPNRAANALMPHTTETASDIPSNLLRKKALNFPGVSELDVVRHYTKLSQRNFSIDTHFYPLGSCTMKYNPRAAHRLASMAEFMHRHPLTLDEHSQGYLSCIYELQDMLQEVTGMAGVSLTPMAGAQGEFAGVAMIRAYHQQRGDTARTEILVPDAAHGTNPASAVMCGYKVREIPTGKDGDIDIVALKAAVGPHTAAVMLTNPSTLGVFERKIQEVAEIIHQAGGMLYYDGANLNAILGKARPGDMGFNVMHINLHKTFATPHGGGGPGSGPVAACPKLAPFLPTPIVGKENNHYRWLTKKDRPQSIGRLSAFMGNGGIMLRAFLYARLLGREGMVRVADFATLNANYLLACLRKAGYVPAFPDRFATHEFILTIKELAKNKNVTAMDVAKRLLDFGFHAPTTYFPMLVPECLLIEPTETESKQTLDGFVAAMIKILEEANEKPEFVKGAPYTLPVRRLDDVKAARELDLIWQEK